MGEEGGEDVLDADGSDTGATTSVGNTEGLVEVEMADIGANGTRRGQANLSVHVGTVHVDETAVLVDEVTGPSNIGLEDTVGAGVGDHNGTKLVSVLLALGLEIHHVEVTSSSVTLDGNDSHTGHGS